MREEVTPYAAMLRPRLHQVAPAGIGISRLDGWMEAGTETKDC
jgi:hypothetical protein